MNDPMETLLDLRDFLDQRADAKYFIGSNERLLPNSELGQ
jgi:hypothetical protein